jgi:hypothetical protein
MKAAKQQSRIRYFLFQDNSEKAITLMLRFEHPIIAAVIFLEKQMNVFKRVTDMGTFKLIPSKSN